MSKGMPERTFDNRQWAFLKPSQIKKDFPFIDNPSKLLNWLEEVGALISGDDYLYALSDEVLSYYNRRSL